MSIFGDVLQQHKERQILLIADNENKLKKTSESIEKLSSHLLIELNEGVSLVYYNQQQIEEEIKKLQLNTSKFLKSTQKWMSIYNKFNDSIKELGDVKDWAISIENDLDSVSSSLEFIINAGQNNTQKV